MIGKSFEIVWIFLLNVKSVVPNFENWKKINFSNLSLFTSATLLVLRISILYFSFQERWHSFRNFQSITKWKPQVSKVSLASLILTECRIISISNRSSIYPICKQRIVRFVEHSCLLEKLIKSHSNSLVLSIARNEIWLNSIFISCNSVWMDFFSKLYNKYSIWKVWERLEIVNFILIHFYKFINILVIISATRCN